MPLFFKALTGCFFILPTTFMLFPGPPVTVIDHLKMKLTAQADSLLGLSKVLLHTSPDKAGDAVLQQRFRQLRLAYKRIEWAAEYFDPLTAKRLNGPPVPEADLSGQMTLPDGLQCIEQCLFPCFDRHKKRKLAEQLSRLAADALTLREDFQRGEIRDWQILDAVKLEVFRVEALGLNNFDAPLAKNCFGESVEALQSLQAVIVTYQTSINFSSAIHYLRRKVDFDHFDRAAFIIHYADPLTNALTDLAHRSGPPDVHYNRLLNQAAITLSGQNAFNRKTYTVSPGDSATDDKMALGGRLFFDPMLSGSGERSCASCHQPEKGFSDGLAKNVDITGKRLIARHTPSLFNAALQPAQFDDLRAASLEDQAREVIQNQAEMHGDIHMAAGKLWQDTAYRRLVNKAYPLNGRTAVDTFEVMNALASYVRSLTALNSRFDAYMRGDGKAMDAGEIAGFNLFMGKAGCSTCHYFPLFSGALPPRYVRMEAEVIGVPEQKNSKHIDPDPGTHGIQPFNFNLNAFKVTTVRNSARTAPYMHNGVFKTLEEVVDFYNKGGGAGMGLHLPNQTLPATPLRLTAIEKKRLIAFIKTLDSR